MGWRDITFVGAVIVNTVHNIFFKIKHQTI